MCKNDLRILHQYNVPAHSTVLGETFLSKNKSTVLEHPSGTKFESVDGVKTKVSELINKLSEDDMPVL